MNRKEKRNKFKKLQILKQDKEIEQMTDKDHKLAEEYRKSLRQRLIDEDEFERLSMFDENVEEAFLAGLEVGKDMTETDLATIAYMQGAERYKPRWHKADDLPKESVSVLVLSSDGSLDECVYIPDEGFKDPVFSTWYTPVAWIEKEKILPKM